MPQAAPLGFHDTSQVDVTWGETIAMGVAPDEWGNVEPMEDATTDQGGEDGSVVVSINNDRRGTVTIRLLETSPTCALWDAQVSRPGFPPIVKPLLVRDRLNGWTKSLAQAWLTKMPPHPLAGEAQVREYVFHGTPLEVAFG